MNRYQIDWQVIAVDNGGEHDLVRRIEAGGSIERDGSSADLLETQLVKALEQRFPRHELHGTYDTDRTYEIKIEQVQ